MGCSIGHHSLRLSSHACSCFNATATTEIYTLSLHDALPISYRCRGRPGLGDGQVGRSGHLGGRRRRVVRSEEHTSELQSLRHLVCRLLLEKKKYRGLMWMR